MGIRPVCIKGKWSVRVNYRRRRKTRQVTPNTEARAIEVAANVRRAIEVYGADALRMLDPEPVLERAPTVGEYAEKWLEEIQASAFRATYKKGLAWAINKHVLRRFSSLPLDQIDYPKLKAWVIGMSEAGYARDSVRIAVGYARLMFEEARREGLIAANPVKDLGRFFPRRKRKEKVDPFTLEELAVLLNACARIYPHWHPFLLFLADTGVRIGEAIGAKVTDIDWHKRSIRIERNVPMLGVVEETKTLAGIRDVDLSTRLVAVLQGMLARRREEWLKRGLTQIPDWLFLADKGGQVILTNFEDHVWRRLLAKTKLRHRTPHDLRHTWASQLLRLGEDPAYVAAMLGHKSIATTIKIYTHWIPGRKRVGVDRLSGENATWAQMDDADESAKDAKH